MKSDEGVYLFCFCRPGAVASLAPCGSEVEDETKLVGLDGAATIEERTVGSVSAVCCRVPLTDFVGPHAEARFREPAWIATRAFAHGRVIEIVRTRSAVLPLHFGTVFTSDEALREKLSRHHDSIARFLDEMIDVHEYAIQAFIDNGQAEDWLLAGDPELAEKYRRLPENPGSRYFQEKKLRGEARKRIKQLGVSLAEDLQQQTRTLGLPIDFLSPRGPDADGQDMIFHAVCLIASDQVDTVLTRIAELGVGCRAQGVILTTSGPWPPYHFCPILEEPAG